MASRIIKDEFETGGGYKITAQFTNYRDYKKACDFIESLNETTKPEQTKSKEELEKIKKVIIQCFLMQVERLWECYQ